MNTHHSLNHAKVTSCFAQLQSMDIVAKSKMFKIYRNVSRAWLFLDQEFVNCRRMKRITPKYTELERNLDECVSVFEQWSIMVVLQFS